MTHIALQLRLLLSDFVNAFFVHSQQQDRRGTSRTMFVTCRLLSRETFELEAADAETVRSLKEKIEKKMGPDFEAESLKLIYAGKVWTDDAALLKDLKYISTGFVVVLVNKSKSSKDSGGPSNPITIDDFAPSASTLASQIRDPLPRPHAPSPTRQREDVNPAAAFGLSAEQYEARVQEIEQMGYPRAEIIPALRAAFYNADRAVEYLLNGLPQISAPPVGSRAAEDDEDEDTQDDIRLRIFRTTPQFQQMRGLVQQDPQLLGQLLHDIGQQNPRLFQAIRDNQTQFLTMLNSPLPEAGLGSVLAPRSSSTFREREADAESPVNDRNTTSSAIRMTPEEREAIERLKSLGFSESLATEAYFSCDKNEQFAANLLFSQLDEAGPQNES